MGDYDAINDEIKNFLSLTDRSPCEDALPAKDIKTSEENISSLVALLTSLQNVYNEINTNLAAGDNEGLKNVILNSDVKMSLVCESLMRVLKDVSQEKGELVKSEEEYKERIRKMNEDREGFEIRINKLESDLEFFNRANQELSRIIRDQKSKIQAFKEKADLEKRNCDSFRSINGELEILRKKALEKCEVYEKEVGVLKEYIKERGGEIERLKNDAKQGEVEREGLSRKIVGLEKSNELLRKKLEMKESAIGMCNSELSKLISKEKRVENEVEKMKERASYYERLYKATNSQNEYLNRQLSKMIRDSDKIEVPEYDPNAQEEMTAMSNEKKTNDSEQSDLKRIKRYRRRIQEQKRMNEKQRTEMQDLSREIEGLRNEVSRLQEERTRTIDANSKIMEELMSKVEKLLEKNREYQGVIYELRGRGAKEDRSRVDFNESFRTVNDGENEQVEKEDLFIPQASGRDEGWRGGNGVRPFALEDDYEEKANDGLYDTSKIYRMGVRNIPSRLSFPKKDEADGEVAEQIKLNLPDSFFNSLANPKKEVDLRNEEGLLVREEDTREERRGTEYLDDPFDSISNKNLGKGVEGKGESDASGTSPKTVRTTSTLHEMLRRTDALQEKFDKLEDHLNAIRNSDKIDAEKVHDQIKAYKNYYYSDYLDMSNESDVI
ncbi:hypothetical protein EHEL_010270 [Encephalitozoon hellem ATCC 50504]|uniref:Uncharacterized protein n=1 Tax=Encephalitozoon hellem TaxID=27973 RepID=A0A9Q9FAK9_ENCHE|nr:uncharacterized protein EHEL_010270 [Encephalitozoon hellem ATCC 50504]AFM97651.1 hypothetical protein EHEL_010270 [Encephalitozoon hellem ATCC 50504]UTX42340.1 hypothetical protein GPU96_01g00420 [Encephalitozoon hellem]|eukprot:XP_003886632.1 hypothetical protein EHEL_010270 [Encephalitozoon hellem ATCC 50504]